MSRLSRRTLLTGLPLAGAQTRRPNFVFVLVDDLRWDELGCSGHPFAETPQVDRLAREGALFRNAFATTPLCSPSRASFLTGQYPHTHGIIDNTDRSARSHQLMTFPRRLQAAGYETAYLGKWHMGNDDSPRPGFDHWISFRGQGDSTDPRVNVNGQTRGTRGYVTDVLTEFAADILRKPRTRPFCLYLAHKAIHPNIQQAADGSVNRQAGAEDFIVAARHKTLYAGARAPHRPNYNRPPADKPALRQAIPGLPPLAPGTGTDDATILNRMRMTKAIDESVGELRAALDRSGQLDDTVFVFTSDHGYFYGEHCLAGERRLAYEETIRIPLVMRYPRLIRAGSKPDGFALSLDIAPTLLELAGVRATAQIHGRSLVPLLQGRQAQWRDSFLVEYFSDTVFPRIRKMGYQAVRTNRWKYIRYRELQGMDELYDLDRDPYEMNNLGPNHAEAGPLREALARLVRQSSG
ncbi:MAG: sulfatase [Bryobacteraceae bacterium]